MTYNLKIDQFGIENETVDCKQISQLILLAQRERQKQLQNYLLGRIIIFSKTGEGDVHIFDIYNTGTNK